MHLTLPHMNPTPTKALPTSDMNLTVKGTQPPLDIFKLVHLGPHGIRTPSPLGTFKLIHYETRTVGKRAVRIALECFLFSTKMSKVLSFFIQLN